MERERIRKLIEELEDITRELGEQAPLDSFYSGYRMSMQKTNIPYQPYHSPVDFSVFQAFKNVSTLADVLAARLEDIMSRTEDKNLRNEISKVIDALHSIKEDADEILKAKPKKEKEVAKTEEEEKDIEVVDRKAEIKKKIKEWREKRLQRNRLYETSTQSLDDYKEDLVNMVEDLTKATDFYVKLRKAI